MECVHMMITEIIALAFALFVTLSETQDSHVDSVPSYFACISTSNAINERLVKESFGRTFSKLHCGMQCSSLAALSFYYDGDTSTCYCNNQTDEAAEPDDINDSIMYCTLFNRTGNSSECQTFYDEGFRTTKVYTIGPVNTPIYCNLSALDWTVFQRRQDGSVNFYRSWAEYVSGFGDEDGEFWMGLEAIHQKTVNECELHIYLEAEPNSTEQDRGYARYSNFRLGSVDTFYTLIVEGFSGNVGNSLSKSSGMAFSTYAADHDLRIGSSCSHTYNASWWMESCFDTDLNGEYLKGWKEVYATGVVWRFPWDYYYSLRRTEMAFRCDDEKHV